MSVRAVWIVTRLNSPQGKLLFSRSFPTVEQKAKRIQGEQYVPLPEPKAAAACIVQAMERTQSTTDHTVHNEAPIYELFTSLGTLWPLLIIEQYGYLFCSLASVEEQPGSNHIDRPGIAGGYTLLAGMAAFLGQLPNNMSEYDERLCGLQLYLSEAAPFGRPTCVQGHAAVPTTSAPTPPAIAKGDTKQPAWRPQSTEKSRNQISITIAENIKAMLYVSDVQRGDCEVYGSVALMADVEGVSPELQVPLQFSAPLDSLLCHPCVQNQTQTDSRGGGQQVSLSVLVPRESVTLCQYTMTPTQAMLPVTGTYQAKGDEYQLEIDVKLKLSASINNNLDYCELHMPFYNRGDISHVDHQSSQGNVIVSKKKTLVWTVGNKFEGKQRTANLSVSVRFHVASDPAETVTNEQAFSNDHNMSAKLFLKVHDSTVSGVRVSKQGLKVKPHTKLKLATDSQLQLTDYRFWNTIGDAPLSSRPPPALINAIATLS